MADVIDISSIYPEALSVESIGVVVHFIHLSEWSAISRRQCLTPQESLVLSFVRVSEDDGDFSKHLKGPFADCDVALKVDVKAAVVEHDVVFRRAKGGPIVSASSIPLVVCTALNPWTNAPVDDPPIEEGDCEDGGNEVNSAPLVVEGRVPPLPASSVRRAEHSKLPYFGRNTLEASLSASSLLPFPVVQTGDVFWKCGGFGVSWSFLGALR